MAGAAALAVGGPVRLARPGRPPVRRAASPSTTAAGARRRPTSRILVVVNLGGGNDGLNTLVPADNGAYHDARPTLGVAEDSLVPAGRDHRLRVEPGPGSAPAVVGRQAAGGGGRAWPSRTRPVRTSGPATCGGRREPDRTNGTGWLGRWLDTDGDTHNPLRAISAGARHPGPARQSPRSPPPGRPRAVRADDAPGGSTPPDRPRPSWPPRIRWCRSATAAASQQAIPDATPRGGHVDAGADRVRRGCSFSAADSANAVARLASSGTCLGGLDRSGGTVTSLLEVAAGIIELQLGTRVIMVSVDRLRHPRRPARPAIRRC